MTIQMLILSILLFGTTGMVLDSGRIYQVHSKMQSFADQVALAAAQELDGEPDAIARACRVMNGVAADVSLIQDVDSSGLRFQIEDLAFYDGFTPPTAGERRTQADISSAYGGLRPVSCDDVGTNDPLLETESPRITHVVAHVSEVEIDSFAGLMYGIMQGLASVVGITPEAEPGSATIDVVAAASMVQETCVDANTLVMCNPYENTTTDYESLAEPDASGLIGRTVMTFANAGGTPDGSTLVSSPFNWDVRNQLFEIASPDPRGQLCTDSNVSAMFGGGSGLADPADGVSACMMGRAQPERFCFRNRIDIKPAKGPVVAGALNTAFDMQSYPFDETFEHGTDIGGTEAGFFFEPDLQVANPYEPMRSDVAGATPPPPYAGLSNADGENVYYDGLDLPRWEYAGIPEPGLTYNGSGWLGGAADWGMHDCHIGTQQAAAMGFGVAESTDFEFFVTNSCNTPFVSDAQSTAQSDLSDMITAIYGDVFGSGGSGGTGGFDFGDDDDDGGGGFDFGDGGDDGGGGFDFGDGGFTFPSMADTGGAQFQSTGSLTLPASVDTWYEAYQFMRAQRTALVDGAAPSGGTRDDVSMTYSAAYGNPYVANSDPPEDIYNASPLPTTPGPMDVTHVRDLPVRHMERMNGLGGCSAGDTASCLPNRFDERRRMTMLVVNCEAATIGGDNGDGTFETEVLDVLDVFLTQPATMFCGYLDNTEVAAAPGQPPNDGNVIDAIEQTSGVSGAIYSRLDCNEANSLETRVFFEIVGEGPTVDRFTPQLTQ